MSMRTQRRANVPRINKYLGAICSPTHAAGPDFATNGLYS